MSKIVERLIKFEEWENKYGELLSKQLNIGKEVVRCRECKYYYNKDPEQIPTASIICSHMHPDDFCSYGEREGE